MESIGFFVGKWEGGGGLIVFTAAACSNGGLQCLLFFWKKSYLDLKFASRGFGIVLSFEQKFNM